MVPTNCQGNGASSLHQARSTWGSMTSLRRGTREHPVCMHIAANAGSVCVTSLESPTRFIDIVRIGLPRTGIESILRRQRYRQVNPDCEPRRDAGTREWNINRGDQMLLRNTVDFFFDRYRVYPTIVVDLLHLASGENRWYAKRAQYSLPFILNAHTIDMNVLLFLLVVRHERRDSYLLYKNKRIRYI